MIRLQPRPRPSPRTAFTLVEVLVGIGILAVILMVVLGIINATGKAWNGAVARTESFQEARAAFEAITRMLSQATLNTYYNVTYEGSTPTAYGQASDLQFLSGSSQTTGVAGQLGHGVFFQAPLGYVQSGTSLPLGGLLNVCGFYVDYSRDSLRPAFLTAILGDASNPYRFRLHQLLQSADQMEVYKSPNDTTWLSDALKADGAVHSFAANVVALVFVPENPAAAAGTAAAATATYVSTSSYDFDSRTQPAGTYLNQLPPVLEVFMAAIDEPSAKKVCTSANPPNLGQNSLFQNPSSLEADIESLDKILSAVPGNAAGNRIPLTHRFFRSKVLVQGAKWSS